MAATDMSVASKPSFEKEPAMLILRCANPDCGRKLCEANGNVEIDCRRCKGRNIFDYKNRKMTYVPKEQKK